MPSAAGFARAETPRTPAAVMQGASGLSAAALLALALRGAKPVLRAQSGWGRISKLWMARARHRSRFLQVNTRWKVFDEIYKIYMRLQRSDHNFSANFTEHFVHNFAKVAILVAILIAILITSRPCPGAASSGPAPPPASPRAPL